MSPIAPTAKSPSEEMGDSKVPNIRNAEIEGDFIELQFEDGSKGRLAFQWLRDNCRCQECYDFVALSRIFELDQLSDDLFPQKVWFQDSKLLNIVWNSHDNHHSVYEKEWLYIRGFISKGKQIYENFRHLEKLPWAKDSELDKFEFANIGEDEVLLDLLMTIEKKGVAVIKNVPPQEGMGEKLINQIGFTRLTHFGKSRTVSLKEHHSYVAYTNNKLGLHTDLTYLVDTPGILFVHAIKQHSGKGGDSIITDGLFCAELMKQRHPQAFDALSSAKLFFWDKFNAAYHSNENRFKIHKTPIFRLNDEGNLEQVVFNNQKRDTNIEIEEEVVNSFYEAFKIFLNVIYENIHTYKLETGDIMVLDNMRFLHGREAFEMPSERKLNVTFLDWDEARSRRRLLQEKCYGHQIFR